MEDTKKYTGNNGYSGDRYSGNDGYSGLNPPDDAILFTVSGITAIADQKLKILMKKIEFLINFQKIYRLMCEKNGRENGTTCAI